ncbi:MAG TPA: hypothetical protein VHC69_27890 [Polyangiaceae bacterium]|nr:hypothetical protein [Polyangiaceae bacterium]
MAKETLHKLAAEVELATPPGEQWLVQTEEFTDDRGQVSLELSDATPAEAACWIALLKKLVMQGI